MTESNHEKKNSPTYRSQKGLFVHSHQVIGKHLWPQHNFQKVIRHKHSPLGVLKFSFHTEIFVNTEEALSDAQFTLISTVITWVPSRSFHSHSLLCLPRFPAGPCHFQLKNKKQIYINHSDLTDRTGHWIENQCLKKWNTKCRRVGMGSWGKQVGSMDEEPQVRGCYNITFICTPTNQETLSVSEKTQANKTFRTWKQM